METKNEVIKGERWKIIPFEGNYERFAGMYAASNYGRIKNVKTGKILKSSVSKNSDGRARISLHHTPVLVHRLVAMAWKKNKNNNPFVCHKDGNCLHNYTTNLYWGTARSNYTDSVKHKRAKGFLVSAKDRIKIYDLYVQGVPIREIYQKFSKKVYSIKTISHIAFRMKNNLYADLRNAS